MSDVVVQTTGGARLTITPQAPRPIIIRRPGDMLASVYDPQGIRADAFNRANHTGTQTLATISDAGTMAAEDAVDYTKTADLAAVALSGVYNDLSGKPPLGGAAALNVGTTAGTVAAGDHTHADATTSVPGFMAATDKARLDGLRSGHYARGHIWGLTLSNNTTDATNDLDIAIGEARDETDTVTMTLASALTKRLDANWAAGAGQGGRYSGAAIANTTYHVWLVGKAVGADADVYLDPSADPATVLGHLQAETGGASYLYVRRIGAILRTSGAIVPFIQNGDVFTRASAVNDRSSTAAATNVLIALSVPTGISVMPILSQIVVFSASTDVNFVFGHGDSANVGTLSVRYAAAIAGTSVNRFLITPVLITNTSGQIRYTQVNNAGTPATCNTDNHGWIDTRGRLA